MGKKKKQKKAKQKRPKVWVCRGGCCGTRKKHPGVDHDALYVTTKEGAKAGGAKVTKTDCLGPCGQGNIVVVRAEGEICWFRKMNAREPTAALADHLAEGRSLADLPPSLARHTMPKRAGKKPKT